MKFTMLVCLFIFSAVIDISVQLSFVDCMTYFMPEWIPEGVDIDAMQALDSGGALTKDSFEHSKFAVKKMNKLIDGLTENGITGDLSGSRSGFIQFHSLWNTEIKIHLPDHDNLEDLNDDIDSQVYSGGMTAMAKALELAGEEFDNSSNAQRNKRVMLITDSYETQGGDPLQEANELKRDHGAEICIIYIGKGQKYDLLKPLATMYSYQSCICGTESWKKLKKGMKKVVQKLKPVIRERRKNRRKQLKQKV